jgi:hypothetical protein
LRNLVSRKALDSWNLKTSDEEEGVKQKLKSFLTTYEDFIDLTLFSLPRSGPQLLKQTMHTASSRLTTDTPLLRWSMLSEERISSLSEMKETIGSGQQPQEQLLRVLDYVKQLEEELDDETRVCRLSFLISRWFFSEIKSRKSRKRIHSLRRRRR